MVFKCNRLCHILTKRICKQHILIIIYLVDTICGQQWKGEQSKCKYNRMN